MKADRWEIREVRANGSGKYFSLNARTQGQIDAPVTVKWCTRYDTMVCLTHNMADACSHARFVRRHVKQECAA